MINSYFRIVFRNFRKDWVNYFINFSGLTVGLTCVILILFYLSYELSFDKHYSNSSRIYQLVMESSASLPSQKTAYVPEPLARTLKEELQDIEAFTSMQPAYQSTYISESKPVLLNGLFVNASFFKVFNLPFHQGNPISALKNESDVVLTKDAASRLFPNQDPVGKTLSRKWHDGTVSNFIITGVIADIPSNTHFNADIMMLRPVTSDGLNFKGYSSVPEYVMVRENTLTTNLEERARLVLNKYNLPETTRIHFVPVSSVHLHSTGIDGNAQFNIGDIHYVFIIGSAAILILLIVSINYVNLTTAQSLQRTKEIGIRKTLGSSKTQLIYQFLGESVVFFSLAAGLAVAMGYLLWPTFSSYLQVQIPITYLIDGKIIMTFVLVSLLAGLLAGLYPAFFVSRMNPTGILNRLGAGRSIFSVRSVLIVFQFTISVVLIAATIVVYQQLELFRNRPLGFNQQHLLVLPATIYGNSQNAFKKALLDNPNISGVSLVEMELGKGIGNTGSMTNPLDEQKTLNFGFINADLDFITTMGIKIKNGRNYSRGISSDILNYDSLYNAATQDGKEEVRNCKPIIITESMAKALGLKNPVDTLLNMSVIQGKVIGVVEDYLVGSLKQTSPLLVYNFRSNPYVANAYIRIDNRNIPSTIRYIEQVSKQFFPDQVFNYSFADDMLQRQYISEQRTGRLFAAFALLGIAISSLGLFSLLVLIIKQRNKEIGIRKTMGASVSGIVLLLSKDFGRLILVGAVIALPLSWMLTEQWLQDFAHRVTLSWVNFVLAGFIAFIIGIVTISFQTIKAARSNPVDSLKAE